MSGTYIAGPMTGLPNFNHPAFTEAAARGRAAGRVILNPAENFGGDQTRHYSEYLRAAVAQVMSADAIALLDGWENSKGARLEVHVAQILGLPILSAATFGPLSVVDVSTAFAGYHPKEALTALATNDQIYERLIALPHVEGTNRVAQVAREFAAACIAALP